MRPSMCARHVSRSPCPNSSFLPIIIKQTRGGHPLFGNQQRRRSKVFRTGAEAGSSQQWLLGGVAGAAIAFVLGEVFRRRNSREVNNDSEHSQSGLNIETSDCILPEGMIFGLDVGGTLGKIVFREPNYIHGSEMEEQVQRLKKYFTDAELQGRGRGAEDLSLLLKDSKVFGGTLHFLTFEARNIERVFSVVRKEATASRHEVAKWRIFATGGGAFKFEDRFHQELGVEVEKSDEMETIVSGVQCLLDHIPNECFTWVPKDDIVTKHMEFVREDVTSDPRKPWLIVNVGSGVSMLKLDEQQTVQHGKVSTYKRVGGTPLGGGTFLGLGCLLTGASSHAELLELAARGNHRNADRLVGDIYGSDYHGLGLSADTVASSFGKLVDKEFRAKVRKEDLARSLVQMISWNIAHLARLVAAQEGVKTIIFTGSFTHRNTLSQQHFAHAFKYWSNGDSRALFMRHEGYVGAIGALSMSTLRKGEHSAFGTKEQAADPGER